MSEEIVMNSLLHISTCGMKNISKEIRIDFANSTIENGIKKVNNVKGIFGFNGAGKTAFITSIDFYKKVLLDPNYLLQASTTKKLDRLLNYHLKSFSMTIIFSFRENTVVKHSIKIEKNIVGNNYIITSEEVSMSSGRTLTDKYTSFIKKDGANYSFIKDERIFKDSIKYLENSDDQHTSFVTKIVSKVIEKNNGVVDPNITVGEKVILQLFASISNLDVLLNADDEHSNYVFDKALLEELINGIEIIKNKKNEWVDLYTDNTTIHKNRIKSFESDNKKLEKFIRLFKPELKEIELIKSEDGELIHIRKLFKYKDYNVEQEFESSGIKQLVKLFSYLLLCSKGKIVFVDEMDVNINSVYFEKLILFFKNYGKGQLIFTSHNIEAMNALKGQGRSIVAFGDNGNIDTWVGKGNKSPIKDYTGGFFPNSPMNIEDFDFVNIFFGEV